MLAIFKNSSKTGDRFTAISDLLNNEERVLFQTGNSVKSFLRKFIVRRYLKYSYLKGQGCSCFSEAILKEFDLRRI